MNELSTNIQPEISVYIVKESEIVKRFSILPSNITPLDSEYNEIDINIDISFYFNEFLKYEAGHVFLFSVSFINQGRRLYANIGYKARHMELNKRIPYHIITLSLTDVDDLEYFEFKSYVDIVKFKNLI